MSTAADGSKTAKSNPNTLVFKVAIDPSETAVLDRWQLAKDDMLFIDPDKLMEVGHGFALVKVVGKITRAERRYARDREADSNATIRGHDSQQQGRTLSQKECSWIDTERDYIERLSFSVMDLADLLVTIAELNDSSKIDPHFKEEIGKKGAMSIGYAIQHLAEKITRHQEEIESVLDGMALAEYEARNAWNRKRYAAAAARRRAEAAVQEANHGE